MTWDAIRHFHRQPAIIALWRRLWGPVLPWLTPKRRRVVLALGAIVFAVRIPLDEIKSARKLFGLTPDTTGLLLVIVALSAFAWMFYQAARRFASWPMFVKRRPQLWLHGCFWVWMILLWNIAPASVTVRTTLAGCAMVLPFLLWRLGYLLFTAQRGRLGGTGFHDHWFYIWPVWGYTTVPYGKGLDYLTTCEAKDEESLARSQLAGIKLIILGLMCGLGGDLMDGLIFGKNNAYRQALGGLTLGLPSSYDMIAKPGNYPLWECWLSIYCDLFRQVLRLGAKGHFIIGYLRLGGFNVFRNTYKPLLAETVVEFWNRYFYYFKELLVNFFFFPVFTRHFKQSPRLRMCVAVFAAAFFGNMYYHVIKSEPFFQGDWLALWKAFNPRLVYCFALALGIYISMRREQLRPRGAVRTPLRRAMAIFGVWTFFAFIHLWARGPMPHTQRFHFLLGLFGLN